MQIIYMDGHLLMVLNEKIYIFKLHEKFIKPYDEESDKRYILEVDVEYLKILHNLHSYLLFLLKRIKIKKFNKLVCNLYNKNNYFVHIRPLKQALNHGLVQKTLHKVIHFNKKAWLKQFIDINTYLRKKAKNGFEKYLLS